YLRLFELLLVEMQHRQFISWLTQQFPSATLSLKVYQSTSQYLDHNDYSAAHIITTADTMPIYSNNSTHKITLSHYQQLCQETYRLNPKICCIYLQLKENIVVWHPIIGV